MDAAALDPAVVEEQVDGRHWRVVDRMLHARFATDSFSTGTRLVAAVDQAAEAAGHHPGIDLRARAVHVRLASREVGGLSERDVALANEITRLADDLGLEPDQAVPQCITIGIDAIDATRVRPFWKAVLGYEDDPDDDTDLVDPARSGPTVWFQQMDEPRPQRNRIHLDVYVPIDHAEQRVAAALEAGGTLVTDRYAPSWWVLADAEGNEACVCTSQVAE
ncbi:4a-hydroxytetrahydrobiopterin dehydratase [Aeromicrobium phragmitis]|uniref:Putative pterin-4-alpha-carbinolamine dehydratase n=1 Tax=Aeromicrobium phragmitis TaxID=2478914 RepID=A0A3L8PPB8_9ACTN|nr:VOC family protein [Aeromicrobium phragmitis]RLV57180.1 4a-hydroxytetrahydrobiopterin dehydratase [Aeromicrobium phragmitis]